MDGVGAISSGTYRGSWRIWTRTPPPALAGLVDYHGFAVDSGAPMTDVVLPGPKVTLILSFGDPLRMVRMPGRRTGGDTFVSFVAGLHDAPGVIGHDGRQAGVQVDLDPLVARAVLGGAVGELAGEVVPVDSVLGRPGERLAERLADAPDWPARFAVLDEILTSGLDRAPLPPPELSRAWQVVRRSSGTTRVDALAREVGWSRRHLAERFRREIGLSPKAASRVVRFDRARGLLAADGVRSLTDLAMRCGYYDHAHLDREFRALAGRPPSRLRDLPLVQDGPAHPP